MDRKMPLILSAAALLVAACGSNDQPAQVNNPPASTNEYEAQRSDSQLDMQTNEQERLAAGDVGGEVVSDLTLGHTVLGDGTVEQDLTSEALQAGEPIHLSMQVNDAPANTPVRVVWYGPNDLLMGEATKQVSPQDEHVSFTATNNEEWLPGQYRAEVWVGQDKVDERSFELAASRQAATSPATGGGG